jgi:hypothetical protein
LRADLDGVVVESALLAAPLLGLGKRLVWDTNELETLHYLRRRSSLGDLWRGIAWFWLETLIGTEASVVVAISDEEASHWRRLFPWFASKVLVCDHLPVVELNTAEFEQAGKRGAVALRSVGTQQVVFLGNLGAKHNIDAARWCIEVLARALPEGSTLVLVGRGTEELVSAYGRSPRILGLGFVEDVDSIVRAADLTVAPLRAGAGVKTKVLHALALGQRVVGTPVAFEGLGSPPGAIVASLGEIPSVVRRLLLEPESAEARQERILHQARWAKNLLDPARLRQQWQAVLTQADLRDPASQDVG